MLRSDGWLQLSGMGRLSGLRRSPMVLDGLRWSGAALALSRRDRPLQAPHGASGVLFIPGSPAHGRAAGVGRQTSQMVKLPSKFHNKVRKYLCTIVATQLPHSWNTMSSWGKFSNSTQIRNLARNQSILTDCGILAVSYPDVNPGNAVLEKIIFVKIRRNYS